MPAAAWGSYMSPDMVGCSQLFLGTHVTVMWASCGCRTLYSSGVPEELCSGILEEARHWFHLPVSCLAGFTLACMWPGPSATPVSFTNTA